MFRREQKLFDINTVSVPITLDGDYRIEFEFKTDSLEEFSLCYPFETQYARPSNQLSLYFNGKEIALGLTDSEFACFNLPEGTDFKNWTLFRLDVHERSADLYLNLKHAGTVTFNRDFSVDVKALGFGSNSRTKKKFSGEMKNFKLYRLPFKRYEAFKEFIFDAESGACGVMNFRDGRSEQGWFLLEHWRTGKMFFLPKECPSPAIIGYLKKNKYFHFDYLQETPPGLVEALVEGKMISDYYSHYFNPVHLTFTKSGSNILTCRKSDLQVTGKVSVSLAEQNWEGIQYVMVGVASDQVETKQRETLLQGFSLAGKIPSGGEKKYEFEFKIQLPDRGGVYSVLFLTERISKPQNQRAFEEYFGKKQQFSEYSDKKYESEFRKEIRETCRLGYLIVLNH